MYHAATPGYGRGACAKRRPRGVHLSRIFGKNYYTTLTVLYISINYNSCLYSYRHNYDCMCAIIIIYYYIRCIMLIILNWYFWSI